VTPKYPKIKVQLSDQDGNAFIVLGTCMREAKAAGLSKEEMDAFRREAMESDYDHLIHTAMRWFDCD
jgi:hypothetical protein